MNSRINESNLVNLSGDLSTLNQLGTKESLALSFPFDHIYACHSVDSERQEVPLDKEVEIAALPDDKKTKASEQPTFEVHKLSQRLTAAESENNRLKNLLGVHLDLIQQQNEIITTKEKLNTALKIENDSLKSKVTRMDRRITVSQRHHLNPAPALNLPPPSPPRVIKNEPSTSGSPMVFKTPVSDFLVPDNRTNPYLFSNDIVKTKPLTPIDPFGLNTSLETDITTYLPGDIGVTSILEPSSLQCNNYSTMIENKRSYLKKDIKVEPRSEPLYTVTSNSGNTIIQKIQRSGRRASGSLGSLCRLPKTPVVKTEPPDNANIFVDDKTFESSFSVNKKSKMINTYGKSKTSTIPKKTPHYTGSLCDRLQLIDTTPTGEDPYQLGEADMREQSPIPKLMLQKTNHGRMKICSDTMGESTFPSRRIYDLPATETSTKMPNKIKLEKRYNLPTIIPYSAPQTTHTLTHMSNTTTDTCTHISTYTHVPKPTAQKQVATLTPKYTSTRNPKYTSTLTSTNACTHVSTYTHTTRNTTARSTSGSYKGSHKTTKSAQSGSRKSNAASKKAAHKSPLTTTPLTNPFTSTFASTFPSMGTHTPALGSVQAMLAFPPRGPVTHTITEIKMESPPPPSPPPPSPPTNLFMQPDLDRIKTEPDLEWPFTSYSSMLPVGKETSLCDFSYGENSNLTTLPPSFDVTDFRQLIESDVAAAAAVTALENMDSMDYSAVEDNERPQKKGPRTTSLVAPGLEEPPDNRRGMGSKRGRKRALSSAGVGKNAKQNSSRPKSKMGRGKAASRGKKSPVPGMMTRQQYHTNVGHPDVSWYFGCNPDIKIEDITQGDCKASTVEVPRWREKEYTGIYSLEGTENLDDKVFEKRHQKLEAEERRQLRWHMRRIREQRHVERLRMRQRDPWYNHSQPSVYTIWPQPQRDLRMIEITDTLPVMAFGEDIPDLPPADFMLPWIRVSKPLKRSKRSKTLH